MSRDDRPKCPKCGESSRWVSAMAKVRYELTMDGLMGNLIAAGATDVHDHIYICGGGHEWKADKP